MYFVKLYKGKDCIVNVPFENRDKALKYYNIRLDYLTDPVLEISFDRAEIWSDNCCLFDYEVCFHV